jgi:hypothetical protein
MVHDQNPFSVIIRNGGNSSVNKYFPKSIMMDEINALGQTPT